MSVNFKNATIRVLAHLLGVDATGKVGRMAVEDFGEEPNTYLYEGATGPENKTHAQVAADVAGQILERGSDIASAATITIGTGGYFHVTGTTTISDIDLTVDRDGREFILVFDGILQLTNGANLINITGANITTAAGDAARFVTEGADVVRMIGYTRKDGTSLAAGGGGLSAASNAQTLTGTSTGVAVTPDSNAALWESGSNIASASTVTFGDGGYFHITGTTTITAFACTTDKAGRLIMVVFDGALTLTHNATTLILPGGANITTAAGDCGDGSGGR